MIMVVANIFEGLWCARCHHCSNCFTGMNSPTGCTDYYSQFIEEEADLQRGQITYTFTY